LNSVILQELKSVVMKQYLMIFAGLCIAFCGYAQYRPNYTFAIGVRGGATGASSGGTIKGFIGESVALEGIVGVWHGGIATTALVEKYVPAFNTRGLNWYFGGGLHYTARSGYSRWYIIDERTYDYTNAGASYGIDLIGGIEYKIPAVPVAFSVDFKPYIEFGSKGGFGLAIDPGLGVKLAF
jgi:hypothetical protein